MAHWRESSSAKACSGRLRVEKGKKERARHDSLRLQVKDGGKTNKNNNELNSELESRAGHRTTQGANGASTLSRELIFRKDRYAYQH